tara:strand:- start:944 stop:1306 length:363 start_codon:yes stop_codon:yes gene_type:complete
MAVLEGLVAFENLEEHEVYQGQSTGKYSIVLSLDENSASKLADEGVKMREYEGVKQRKFSTKYTVPVFDNEGNPFQGRIGRGSKVRVLYQAGNEHPVHGTSTYLNKVKVIELAEDTGGDF